MNETERERIVKDIVNHKIEEVETGGGGSISASEIDELEEELRACSDEELKDWWFSNVGEWIASMSRWERDEYQDDGSFGMNAWEARGFASAVEWQFNSLLDDGETEYGFQSYRYDQPY